MAVTTEIADATLNIGSGGVNAFAADGSARPPAKQNENASSLSGSVLDMFKGMERMEIVLLVLIFIIIGFCLLFFLLAVLRRLYNAHRYAVLDNVRSRQMFELKHYMQNKASLEQYHKRFAATPESTEWVALEYNLFDLMGAEATRTTAARLFDRLGYVDYYIGVLKGRKVIARAQAVSKLGRMANPRAAKPVLEMLQTDHADIASVAVRALGKIGEGPELLALLERLPGLLQKNLVTQKTIDASLVAAGPRILPTLLTYARTCTDARLTASLLEVMYDFPATREIYEFAVSHLGNDDAEVRAKALKLIAPCEEKFGTLHDDAPVRLLSDPVWYVRLQAVRTLGRRRDAKNAAAIAVLMRDERWQVRNEAALALTLLGRDAVDAFRTLLMSDDRYARESVCEEMEKSGFVEILLDLLGSGREGESAKAHEILTMMVSCGFVSPLKQYLVDTDDPERMRNIQSFLTGAAR
ncbi:MAG TPA: HEAT repeat domain-containing protein [Smithellaceae bacterium]|nr:HEAT repeat domain-containing protein [Smithellaceae bacterium]HOQ71592.1 HEAT repeat domain-containing protein [Smithellaceae bacterium]